MKNLIRKNLKGDRILFLFILAVAVYVFMLKVTIPEVMVFSGGMKILDMMPLGYDSNYVNLLFETLGKQGRHVYLFHQIPADMIYPFLFGVSNCLILAWFLDKLDKFRGPAFALCLIPLLAGIFDYCENIGIISLLNVYPHIPDFLSKITAIFSVLKSLFTTLYFVVLLITLVIFGLSRIVRKGK